MPLTDLLQEADRQLTICNACRYCEGYCAVFPALEKRRTLDTGDLVYLANLCHDCRACYYACMYAPPHEFAVNIPLALSSVREATYRQYSWPRVLLRVVGHGWQRTLGMSLLAGAIVSLGVGLGAGSRGFFREAGSFYDFVPYLVMLTLFLTLSFFVLVSFAVGVTKFWIDTATPVQGRLGVSALSRAIRDVLSLRYLKGGGPGCYYPADQPSAVRRLAHSLVFYGFLLDFGATVSAAVLQDAMGVNPPYPLWSVPVVLGSVGGAMLVLGATALIRLKQVTDQRPSSAGMAIRDYALLVSLDLAAITGFALLALRGTSLVASALSIHLGSIAVLFLCMPYGKFAHAVYRFAALVEHAGNQPAPASR